MIAFCAFVLFAQSAQAPAVTWVKLGEEKAGRWKATAKYPVLSAADPLSTKANELLRARCEGRFRSFVAGRQDTIVPPATPREFVLDSFLSVAGPQLVSFQVRVRESGGGLAETTELAPVTCATVGGEPRSLNLADILKLGADRARFAQEVVLPLANVARRSKGLGELKEFPGEALDVFAVTQKNLAFAVGPGVVAPEADQVRVPLDSLGSWLDPNGPLGSKATAERISVHVTGYATWIHRETLPIGAELVVSLLRDKDDPIERAFGSARFYVLTPPANFEAQFPVTGVGEEDRLFLDVRIVADGRALYRNRAAVRVPLQGWTSKREVKLVKQEG